MIDLIAIDPSTGDSGSPLGVCLFIGVPERGPIPTPYAYWARAVEKDENSEIAAILRMSNLSQNAATMLSHHRQNARGTGDGLLEACLVAWEAPFLHPAAGQSNARTFGTLSMAVAFALAAMKESFYLHGAPRYPIRPMEAATVYGGERLKSAEKKKACRQWAGSYFPYLRAFSTPFVELPVLAQEAVADACSVGVKAIELWRSSEASARRAEKL